MSSFMYKILIWIVAADTAALGILVLFLINARINLKRSLKIKGFYYRAMHMAQIEKSSDVAAERLNISREDFEAFCHANNMETPEERESRIDRDRKNEEAERQRILNEEAEWRAEQERIIEERRSAQEDESKRRKERLKKFGFK